MPPRTNPPDDLISSGGVVYAALNVGFTRNPALRTDQAGDAQLCILFQSVEIRYNHY